MMRAWWVGLVVVGVACGPARDPKPPVPASPPALIRVLAVDAAAFALTMAGALVRVDTARTAAPTPAITALARDGSRLLYAAADGSFGTVDLDKLAVARLGSVVGTPYWLGVVDDRAVVVTRDAEVIAHVIELRPTLREIATHIVPRGRFAESPAHLAVARHDQTVRLWYGIDAGELGGAAGALDLTTGTATPLDGIDKPVRGILATRDGRVLIYGGITHLSSTWAFVIEARDPKVLESRWSKHGSIGSECVPDAQGRCAWQPEASALAQGRPPVAIAERGGRLRVIVGDELWEVDAAFGDPKLVARLVSARANSNVHVRDVATLPNGDLLVATAEDGLLRVRGDRVDRVPLR